MPALDIFGSFSNSADLDNGASQLVNCRVIARKPEESKLAKTRLVGSPGLTKICQPTTDPCIVLCTAQDTIFSGHAGGQIYSGVETGSPHHVGDVTINPGEPIIRMAETRSISGVRVVAIASNGTANGGTGSGYVGFAGLALYPCGFQALINFDPSSVCVLDSYAVWAGASGTYADQTDKMYSSIPLDPGNVPANSWATAEARADAVLDVITTGRALWVLGARTVEVWYNPGGNVDFAFSAYQNSLIEVGLLARRTLATLHSIVIWVGTDLRVWMGRGQNAQPVSYGWIDLFLQQVGTAAPTNLTAYMYGQGGDEFYVLSNEGIWTIELAVSTMTWIHRQTYNRQDHTGLCAVEYNKGITYVGLISGEVCKLDLNTATEPHGTMPRTIITPWLGVQEARHVINQIDVTSYMGPDAGTFTLDWSEDRKNTWKGQRTITWPDPGTRRAIARAMGTSRRRQVRLSYTGTKAPFEMDEFFVQVSEEGG